MELELIQLWGYRCQRCRHEWVPRDKTQKPRVCPKCKNPYWDRPRKDASGESSSQAKKPAKKGRAKVVESSEVAKE